MTFIQALLCGLVYYLGASTWIAGAGFYTLARPVIAGFFVGLILGDPAAGTAAGAAIQMVYLGYIAVGGAFPADSALAGVIGTALSLQSGLSPQEAIVLAVPAGMLGIVFYQIRMAVIGILWAHISDLAAEKGQTGRIWYTAVLFPELCMFVIYTLPVVLALYYGTDAIKGLVDELAGSRALAITGVIGGMLPALGIAMNMKAIFKGDARLFFFAGFFMVVFLNLNLVAVGCFAALPAILYAKLVPAEKI